MNTLTVQPIRNFPRKKREKLIMRAVVVMSIMLTTGTLYFGL